MPAYAYDRLSARDNLFLVAETEATPMHIGAVQIGEANGLRTPAGGIDLPRLARALECALDSIPRYRQKLRFPRFGGRPVWVDDPHFDLDYHVRHVCLPRPGTPDQLKCEVSRILELPLDRSRSLWEIWVVEGVSAGEQFALVSKIHHCMLDGAAGADLASRLASPDPTAEIGTPEPYHPKPAPSSLELLRDEWMGRVKAPLRGAKRLATAAAREQLAHEARRRATALGKLAVPALRPASETPLNGALSPRRRVDWLSIPLGEAREVKKVLSCTLNDLVLATVAGALRSYLIRHRIDPAGIDLRVAAPVNMRSELQNGKLGNFVSSWIVPLPVREPKAAARLEAICTATLGLKQRRAELGIDTLLSLSEWLPESIVALGVRAASGPANLIVTNVPGPQFPLYQLGSKLLGIYPLVPCLPGSGLGIALFSYDGKLCWGLAAEPKLVPDLPELTRMLDASYRELAALALAAGLQAPSEGRRPEAA